MPPRVSIRTEVCILILIMKELIITLTSEISVEILMEWDVKQNVEKNRNEEQERERFSKNYSLKIGYEWKKNEIEEDIGST